MSELRIGIVGSGLIAGVIARAINEIDVASLAAVASRREEAARDFAEEYSVSKIYNTWQEMVGSGEIDAVYVATPTAVKEEISIAAAQNGKHLLVDKPFADQESLVRIITAARGNNVAFMDGTHFVHHPRTLRIKETMEESIGKPQAVRTSFFFPFLDRENIRMNPDKEPTGAVGDMAWYSMRAAAEYLQIEPEVEAASGNIVRDPDSGAVIRGAGMLAFKDGKTTSFDFGYDVGVCLMDLDILGQRGMFHLDDFVLDWKSGFAFDNPSHVVGYYKRTEMQTPDDFEFIAVDSAEPQTHIMLRNFCRLCQDPGSESEAIRTKATLMTQFFLDEFWKAVQR